MTKTDYTTEADQLDEETHDVLYDRATGGIQDQPVREWIDQTVEDMRSNPHHEYDASDAALKQAALEAAADALGMMADDGYHDHF